ncbi:MBL fold metallo-hydrolase [Maridesulfovibrio sp.]|uniref:MBL fold metallo-hydrolase n=1 Tax=Maridesulfovibrio sp. TaxID=2795000 RepID=UPI0029F535EF|nr:MBL fold metallo-hydrolase [Maridesulfovibrio sp.]
MTKILPLRITQDFGTEQVDIYPTLLITETLVILFDACFPHQIDQLEEALGNHGYSLIDITHVIISHHDHIGSLAAIKRRNKKLTVISHEIEEPYISGKKESLRIAQAREYNTSLSGEDLKWGEQFLNYLQTIETCEIDRTVSTQPEDLNDDITILHSPGHTPGHISIFVCSSRSYIAGDSLAIEHGKLVIANPQFTLDMGRCVQTIREIRELKPTRIYCYHGGVVDNTDNAGLDALLLQAEKQ